ncbi:MAG: GNAT family N-acetyltransferase [Calditrichaeota bacterium]|nr:GNAT family N-acetyltransferase [Calditrichota bacterium]
MYSVRLINDVEEFRQMEADWEDLKVRAEDHLVYSSHPWICTFFDHFPQKAEPYILLVHEGERLVGAAPLMRVDGTYTRIAVRRLEFVSSSIVGDLNDIIAAGDRRGICEAIFDFLWQHREDWDYTFLMLFLENYHIAAEAPEILTRRKTVYKSKRGPDGYKMAIRGNWDDYYATRSNNLKKMLNNRANRMEKAGGVKIEHYTRPEEVEQALAEMKIVHGESWQGQKGCGVFSPRQNGFYETFAHLAAARGWLDVWILKVGGKPVSMEYSVVYNRVAHCLKWEYDGEFHKLSPGLVLRRHSLQYYFERELLACDLLSRYGEMKLKWTDVPTETHDMLFFNTTAKGRLLARASTLRRTLKDLQKRFRGAEEEEEYVAGI